MADDGTRISPLSGLFSNTAPVRQISGVAPSSSGTTNTASSSNDTAPRNAVKGQRGNRMLPADYPLDQLDRRAERGTYLDILV
ncbi:MAG TPA: hypothetical protein VL974_05750 [Magnetospirillum sp.]|jgi:hypothetical protein|nr:hypothetical protein [Magnetospirillum sp.]